MELHIPLLASGYPWLEGTGAGVAVSIGRCMELVSGLKFYFILLLLQAALRT